MSLMGNYEKNTVYYQGVFNQISKLLTVNPARQPKWRNIQAKLTQEWELVRSIQTPLAFFTKEGRSYSPAKQKEPTRDEDTWSQPAPSLSQGGGAEAEEGEGQCRDWKWYGRRRGELGAVLRLQLV